jgi:hypothetical protein
MVFQAPTHSLTLKWWGWIQGCCKCGGRSLLASTNSLGASSIGVRCDCYFLWCSVYMTQNPVHHQRTKHVEIDLHFVWDRVTMGEVQVLHVPSSSQFVDIFTKGLPSPLFLEFGIVSTFVDARFWLREGIIIYNHIVYCIDIWLCICIPIYLSVPCTAKTSLVILLSIILIKFIPTKKHLMFAS